ncbi:hypothetical protein HPP92_001413 [Vanilla planifolia]|uniref:Uncharacterized protein n=1 Tax=Vanilla planifolia TaxID=51239 RepID=A0A835VLT7_VANPL|nr:hypothetical protein HPP92_001413 [Vanilla planifolia]
MHTHGLPNQCAHICESELHIFLVNAPCACATVRSSAPMLTQICASQPLQKERSPAKRAESFNRNNRVMQASNKSDIKANKASNFEWYLSLKMKELHKSLPLGCSSEVFKCLFDVAVQHSRGWHS